MQFAAALIEYIITGLFSLIWIVIIASQHYYIENIDYNKYKELFIIFTPPIAYVMGIYIDTTSSYFIRRIDQLLSIFKKFKFSDKGLLTLKKIIFGTPKTNPYTRSAKILSYSPADLVRTMDTYVSRDRMARGMALNSLITGCILEFTENRFNTTNIVSVCFFISIISIMIWIRLRRLSKEFKTQAIIKLNDLEKKRKKY